jgi:predicted  nucleic acid-binding Zn-ribbon protein
MQKNPVFVKIDEYKKLLDAVDSIKKQIESVRKTMHQIELLRAQEEQELLLWKNNLVDVEKEVAFLDRTLFEPEN